MLETSEGHVRKMLTGPYVNNFRAGFIHVDEFQMLHRQGMIAVGEEWFQSESFTWQSTEFDLL